MNYMTTNIRIPEEDYLRLKNEAAKKRMTLAAVIREKLGQLENNDKRVETLLAQTKSLAKRNVHAFKGLNGVSIIRQMRNNAKW